MFTPGQFFSIILKHACIMFIIEWLHSGVHQHRTLSSVRQKSIKQVGLRVNRDPTPCAIFQCGCPGEKNRCLLLNIKIIFQSWCRGTESNCRHGDFQTKFLKIQKYSDYNQLILFQFFILFLVSFGTVWKYLTLTGTIWAQFSFKILILKQINVLCFTPRLSFGF